ncbi:hypothetical protein SAY87_010255 [Trapa incisa]|uniref:Uncharacterized protein n=1 Tax=Trapa incisa TaxID=236973 RepID=A0AAN7GP79_9MYRT|nr:hypothetical protein SAY87_010255 [Trapa incisa]
MLEWRLLFSASLHLKGMELVMGHATHHLLCFPKSISIKFEALHRMERSRVSNTIPYKKKWSSCTTLTYSEPWNQSKFHNAAALSRAGVTACPNVTARGRLREARGRATAGDDGWQFDPLEWEARGRQLAGGGASLGPLLRLTAAATCNKFAASLGPLLGLIAAANCNKCQSDPRPEIYRVCSDLPSRLDP